MKKLSLLLVFAVGLLYSTSVIGQQSHQKLISEMNYLLYLPDAYQKDTDSKFPLVLFLHGSGERGTDVDKVKVNGLPKLIEAGKKFPFIVVSPQASEGDGWDIKELFRLIQDLKKKYRLDEDRLYLTGLSMGGYGSWEMAQKYPGLFAAVVPVCGGGDISKAWTLRNTPIWVFHGAKDNVVPLKSSQDMVDAVKAYNPSIRFTVFPNAFHDSWSDTYATDSLYTWLLKQKKFRYKQIPMDKASLDRYVGQYVDVENRDTVQIKSADGILLGEKEKKTFELKPYAKDKFFIHPDKLLDIAFSGKEGAMQITVSEEKRYIYKQIK